MALLPPNPAARACTVLAEPDFGSSVGVYQYKPGEGCGVEDEQEGEIIILIGHEVWKGDQGQLKGDP